MDGVAAVDDADNTWTQLSRLATSLSLQLNNQPQYPRRMSLNIDYGRQNKINHSKSLLWSEGFRTLAMAVLCCPRWDKLCEIIAWKDKDLPIDGQSLNPAVVVAVAR